jgi:hypothetical protein
MFEFITSKIKKSLSNPMLNNSMVQTAIAGTITAETGIPISPQTVGSVVSTYNKMIGKGHDDDYSITILQNGNIHDYKLFNDKKLALKKLKNDINKLRKQKLRINVINRLLYIYIDKHTSIVLKGFAKEDNLSLKGILYNKYNKY